MADDIGKEFVETYLVHEYDPVKAREYYLRTRKLKGRKKGQADESSPRAYNSLESLAPQKAKHPKTIQQKKASVEQQLKQLEARLDKLNEVLKQLIEAAKARSGVEPEKKDSSKSSSPTKSSDRKLTTSQKKDAAERSKEAYEKEKKSNPSQEVEAAKQKIAEVRQKILDARADLLRIQRRRSKSQADKVATKAANQLSTRPTNRTQTALEGR